MFKRLALTILLLWVGSHAASQGLVGAVRWSTCVNLTEVMESPVLCNVTGFLESKDGIGFLGQVTPRLGPPSKNWQVRTYTTRFSREIGPLGTIQQVGVTTGRESGDWFVRLETDVIIEFTW